MTKHNQRVLPKILIVEDEPIVAADLSLTLNKFGYRNTRTENSDEAIDLLYRQDFDLFLLDISVPGSIDGIGLANEIRKFTSAPIVFLTAFYDRTTLDRVKEVHPDAYILKPYEEQNLKVNLELAMYHRRGAPQMRNSKKLFVRHHKGLVSVDCNQILYIQADDNYSQIFTSGQQYLLTCPIKKLEEKLVGTSFIRIHKSYIVNLAKVTSVHRGEIYIRDKSLPLGRAYKQEFMNALTIL